MVQIQKFCTAEQGHHNHLLFYMYVLCFQWNNLKLHFTLIFSDWELSADCEMQGVSIKMCSINPEKVYF